MEDQMSLERAEKYLKERGFADRIILFDVSSATVALAAQALGCEECRIAKTLSFDQDGKTVLVVVAGDARIDNHKYKETFHVKARMLPASEAEERTGHAVGGVCPFGVKDGVSIFLDVSLKRFDTVYPAAGTSSSAVRLSPAELEGLLSEASWIDVCKS